ncbi:MAG: TatD family hydrolase [Chitinivibrionales bacterium]|nr:TatD family hydrolase [Chitinivibrionales bacterium]
MWIDIHAHLYDRNDEEVKELVAQAHQCGVGRIVDSATSLDTAATVIHHCTLSESLSCTVGISPFDVERLPLEWEQHLQRLIRTPAVIGIGEIGLDNSHPSYPPINQQLPVFQQQLGSASDADMPVILHSRSAEEMVIHECRNAGITKAVFHCFTGSLMSLKKLLDSGFFISFSGIITFRQRTQALIELVKYAPLDRLFIETDTPYLAPHPHRGKTNQPAFVPLIGRAVASIKGCSEAVLAQAIENNFTTLFRVNV